MAQQDTTQPVKTRSKLSRRELFRGGGKLVFQPETGPRGDVLVTIFLRGGMDGLHTVPPYADALYRKRRPTLGPSDPGKKDGIVDLDGFFGLHPDLAPLAEPFRAKELAIVHASGSPDATLSHFEAMQTMERGVSDGTTTASGWISRHLASLDTGNDSPLRAIAFGDVLPKSLQGSLSATAVRSLSEFHLGIPKEWAGFREALVGFYGAGEDPVRHAGGTMLGLLDSLEKLNPDSYVPGGGAKYPETDLGRGLRQAAQLIKADLGLELATVDLGGWDAHFGQIPLMTGLMKELAGGLSAFRSDLGEKMRRVTVIAMTEFGRRVYENGSLGTDHGRGSAMFLMGGGIRGGKVYGEWPGLADGQVDKDGNLRVTTDYRDILGEVVRRRLGNPNVGQVFPGHQARFLGLTHA